MSDVEGREGKADSLRRILGRRSMSSNPIPHQKGTSGIRTRKKGIIHQRPQTLFLAKHVTRDRSVHTER